MTPEQAAEYELLKARQEKIRERARIYKKNKQKILKSLTPAERKAYRDDCARARLGMIDYPKLPGSPIPSDKEI